MAATPPSAGSLDDREIVARLPGLPLDHESKAFYAAWLDRRLVANRCGDCGHWSLPLRRRCPRCWSINQTLQEVTGRGEVFLATDVHQRRPFSGKTPDTVASVTVELAEQP